MRGERLVLTVVGFAFGARRLLSLESAARAKR